MSKIAQIKTSVSDFEDEITTMMVNFNAMLQQEYNVELDSSVTFKNSKNAFDTTVKLKNPYT